MRLERMAYRLGGDRSIQLSYSPRTFCNHSKNRFTYHFTHTNFRDSLLKHKVIFWCNLADAILTDAILPSFIFCD